MALRDTDEVEAVDESGSMWSSASCSDEQRQREQPFIDLQMMTDAALSWLATDDLLHTLLDRVLKIVDAETATVLLLDVDHHNLVARASRGLEEEVRQGVRIPFGRGFAGHIASERRPIMIDRVDSTTVTNPLLWESGVKVMLGVPLVTGDEVLGVLHVGRQQPTPFTAEDSALLSVAADRMAAAIQAERRRQAEAAAALLVDSLCPDPPPSCTGLDFATRYMPTEHRDTGGDWYDLFLDDEENLWIIIGDVAGHGLEAAVVMGRAQTTMRAFASLGEDPARVLERTDRAMQLFDRGVLVTSLCAVMPPPYRVMHIAGAGHPPPVLAVPGAYPATTVPLIVGPPLGISYSERRASRTVAFPEGATAVFYTDGLVERRGEAIDASIDSLCLSVRACAAESVCHDILHRFVGRQALRDDAAIVVVHSVPSQLR